MPTWSDYKNISKERGSLAFELFCIRTELAASPEEMQKHLPEHLAYQQELERNGILFLAGPLSDSDGVQMSGGGMIIYKAKDIKEAKKFAENDPMHKSGVRRFSISAWLVNEGSISMNVNFAGQKAQLL